jgi:hypothetical protein
MSAGRLLAASINAKQAKEILGTPLTADSFDDWRDRAKGGRSTVRWLVNPKAKPSAETAETYHGGP